MQSLIAVHFLNYYYYYYYLFLFATFLFSNSHSFCCTSPYLSTPYYFKNRRTLPLLPHAIFSTLQGTQNPHTKPTLQRAKNANAQLTHPAWRNSYQLHLQHKQMTTFSRHLLIIGVKLMLCFFTYLVAVDAHHRQAIHLSSATLRNSKAIKMSTELLFYIKNLFCWTHDIADGKGKGFHQGKGVVLLHPYHFLAA